MFLPFRISEPILQVWTTIWTILKQLLHTTNTPVLKQSTWIDLQGCHSVYAVVFAACFQDKRPAFVWRKDSSRSRLGVGPLVFSFVEDLPGKLRFKGLVDGKYLFFSRYQILPLRMRFCSSNFSLSLSYPQEGEQPSSVVCIKANEVFPKKSLKAGNLVN